MNTLRSLSLTFAAALIAAPVHADFLVSTGTEMRIVSNDGATSSTFIAEAATGIYYDGMDDYVYYVGPGNSIRRANRDGSNVTTLIADAGGWVGDVAVDRQNNKLIWTDTDNARIRRANLDGSGAEDLILGVSLPEGLVVDSVAGDLYWAGLGEIQRANLDGTNITTIVIDFDGGGSLNYFTIAAGKIYWTNSSDGSVKRANLDGSSTQTLVAPGDAPSATGIAYSESLGRVVYIGNTGGATMRKMNSNGSDASSLAALNGFDIVPDFTPRSLQTAGKSRFVAGYTGRDIPSGVIGTFDLEGHAAVLMQYPTVDRPHGLAFSKTLRKLYWTEAASGKVRRADPEGTNIETLVTIDGARLSGIALSDRDNQLVVSDYDNGALYSMSLDGENVGTLVSLLAQPAGVATARFGGVPKVLWGMNRALGEADLLTANSNVVSLAELSHAVTTVAVDGLEDPAVVLGTSFGIMKMRRPGESSFTDLPGFTGDVFAVAFDSPWDSAQRSTVLFGTSGVVWYRSTLNSFVSPVVGLGGFVTGLLVTDVSLTNPVALPTPAPAGNTVTGKVSVADSAGNRVSASKIPVFIRRAASGGSVRINAAPVYARPARAVLTDANGQYTFSDLEQGDYVIRFKRDDLAFADTELNVQAGASPEAVLATGVSLAHAGCTLKSTVDTISGADTKSQSLLDFGIRQALAIQSLADRHLTGTKLTKVSTGVTTALTALQSSGATLLDQSFALPRVRLTCSRQPTCSKQSFKSQVSSYKRQLSAMKKSIAKVLSLASKNLPKAARFKHTSLSARLESLAQKAGKSAEKLPPDTMVCSS